MRLAALNILLGAAIGCLGWQSSSFQALSLWLGCSFVVIGLAYGIREPSLLGKRADGTLSSWSWIALLPLHLLIHGVWHLARWCTREPASNQVSPSLLVGRRLLSRELPSHIEVIVDLTAEFQEPAGIRRRVDYRAFPVLDASTPDPKKLRDFIRSLPQATTFVHCAQGHGQIGLFAIAFLVLKGDCKSADEAFTRLQAARPAIALNREQRAFVAAHFGSPQPVE